LCRNVGGKTIGGAVVYRSLLAVLLPAFVVGACALVDPVDTRYDEITRSLAKARNEAIFLNLVRASHDHPLSFATISQVTPSLTNVSSFGLPTFLAGPIMKGATPVLPPYGNALINSTTASNTTTVSSNFNVATQETSAFYQGFLKPVDLVTLNYFIRQGYPRELLFWLFTDSFELTIPHGRYGYRYNPPTNYGCSDVDPKRRCFIDWVELATLGGLTVEEKTVQKESGGRGARGGGTGSEGSASAKSTTNVYARFCFSRILGEQAQVILRQTNPELLLRLRSFLDMPFEALYSEPLRCGGTWDPLADAGKPQPDILPLKSGPFSFRIIPRSAYGVFELLGTLIKMQRQHVEPLPGALIPANRVEELTAPPIMASVPEDYRIITVVQDSGAACFSHTWFYDGDYCVPEQATTTKRVFSLLAQLIAITTAASDLSITPIVRVVQ
jgi:hypothetical protein